MKLNAISRGAAADSSEAFRNIAVAEFMSKFPLANWAEFYSITGNADSPRRTDSKMTAGEQRTIGDDYTAISNTPAFGSVALKIYGGEVKTDYAHNRRGADIGSQRTRDLVNFAGSLGRFFMDSFINDELSATTISGLAEQCGNLSRVANFTGDDGGLLTAGMADDERKTHNLFIEWLIANIEDIEGGPDVLVLNSLCKARLESIGRNYIQSIDVANVYGANQRVSTFFGVPIVNAGFKANATGLIIPNDEVVGNSDDCTSIYLVKFGEETDLTFATNVGLDVHDLGEVSTQYRTLVELDVDLVCLNAMAVKRLAGIRLIEPEEGGL